MIGDKMTKIRAATIMEGVMGPRTMKGNSAAMYIRRGQSWSKKPVVLANIPYTATNPTPRQKEWRDRFGATAKQGRGSSFDRERNLPGVAAYIQDHLGRGGVSARNTRARVYPRRRRY